MNFTLLMQYTDVIFRELWQRKFLCVFGFAFISFSILVVGMFWPSKFQTAATIFADNQNILKPLLAKKAAQSKVQNHTKVVRDMMHSPRLLQKVLENTFGVDSFESAEELGQKVNELRAKIIVKGLGAGYIKIAYTDSTAELSYKVINNVIDIFIKTSADEQRAESREAFLFIDNQVKQYKDQLILAEENLKNFRSNNFDGRDGDVDASISRLRALIEELKISLEEDQTIIAALVTQLSNESEFTSKKFKADIYGERLAYLELQKNNLLLSYTDDYPDVVSLTYQIADIKKAIRDAADNMSASNTEADGDETVLNPLFQELRSRLSLSRTDVQKKEKRLLAFGKLKLAEYDRRKRIAERGAEESELTRDYTVTKRIYEDMLERKENARLSMTLNIEGQGVTFRIQEPALSPLNPKGLRFLHFVILGPILGLLSVLGLAVVYVVLDQRMRFPSQLQGLSIATLAVIPHVKTTLTKRIVRIDMIICLVLGVLIMAAYIAMAYAVKMGTI